MNHLAHFDLAGDAEGSVVGALLADYHKGPLDGRLPPAVELGVRLHRRIDAFTDAHPQVRALRTLFPGSGRRLAGVVLDLCFDGLLARHWSRFHAHADELAVFTFGIHAVLDKHAALLPEAGQAYAQRLREHDLLRRYTEQPVVEAVLQRIGQRLGLGPQMQLAMASARARDAEIERGFLTFYPDAIDMAREFRVRHGMGTGRPPMSPP